MAPAPPLAAPPASDSPPGGVRGGVRESSPGLAPASAPGTRPTVGPSAGSLAGVVAALRGAVHAAEPRPLRGRVERVVGAMIEARLGGARVGELCRLGRAGPPAGPADTLAGPAGAGAGLAEVVGVNGRTAMLAPIGEVTGLAAGAEVEPAGHGLSVPVGRALLGRVLDGLGRPLDRPDSPIEAEARAPLDRRAPAPLDRPLVQRPLHLGTRVLDGLLTCAEGQRVGIFGQAGAGKSTLMARIVRGAEADVFVVALVGERGREVREFIDRSLGPEGMARAVVVAATSDRPAMERVKAAQTATTIAEWFRDQGLRVVLFVDSVTRLARAWREVGLAAGEPPTRRGYPPSVFAAIPRLLERAGGSARGSITAFYTVLVEGETAADPVAEEVKSVLDGHVVLSPKLAEAEHHPAVDVLASRSRVMEAVVDDAHRAAAARVRRLMARYAEVELLVRVGEYQRGADALADEAVDKIEDIRAFLRQPGLAMTPWDETLTRLRGLAS